MSGPVVVGRRHASARVEEVVAHAACDGSAMLIVGDPGTGKSAMLDQAAQRAAGRGMRVLRTQGVEFEADVGHAVLNHLLVPLSDVFGTLSVLHRDALTVALGLEDGPVPDPLVVANAALAVLRGLTRQGPVLVIVDDLAWVDRASAFVLGFVARRLSGTQIGLLAGQRGGEASFLERAGVETVVLEPLDDEDASALLRSRFPSMTAAVVRRLLAESQGVPLALLELARELDPRQRSSLDPLPAFLPLGRRLRTVYAARVRELPQESRELLLAAALETGGRPRASALSPIDDGIDHLGPAERAGLLRVDPSTRRIRFTHPLLRSAVVEIATSGELRAAHRRLAHVAGAEPEARGPHLAVATIEPDHGVAPLLAPATDDGVPAVRDQLMLAVGEFVAGRWDRSAELTRQAHQHLAREPSPILLCTAWYAEALLAAGRGDVARCAELCEAMRQQVVPRGPAFVDHCVAQVMGLCASGRRDFDAAYRHYASIGGAYTFAPEDPFARWILMDLVEAAERSGRHAFAVAHVGAARDAGVSRSSSRFALLCAAAEAIVADADSATAAFADALRTPGAHRWPFDLARIELACGEHLRRQRHPVRARVHLQSALDGFARVGAAPWEHRALSELHATSRTRRSPDSSSPCDLTPQELETALLGATGLTNRQIGQRMFISPRTVSAHLYRVFPKLGIETRAGLRDALPRQTGSAASS